ncbi:hypothetical protein ABK040_003976 [Willaertia magna]
MRVLSTAHSPSLMFCNLHSDEDYVYFISRNIISYFPRKSLINESLNISNECKVIERVSEYTIKNIKPCLNGKLLVATTNKGVLFYETKLMTLMFFHKVEREISFYYTAIASIESKIYVGDSNGQLTCFDAKSIEDIKLDWTKQAAYSPITSVGCNDRYLIIGTGNGDIKIFDRPTFAETSNCHNVTDNLQFPVVGIVLLGNVAITAFASGHIRVYNLVYKEPKQMEVAAHSLPINAIDAFLKGEDILIATASEDTYVLLWKLSKGKIELISSEKYKDNILTGVGFIHENILTVAVYEKKKLYLIDV